MKNEIVKALLSINIPNLVQRNFKYYMFSLQSFNGLKFFSKFTILTLALPSGATTRITTNPQYGLGNMFSINEHVCVQKFRSVV